MRLGDITRIYPEHRGELLPGSMGLLPGALGLLPGALVLLPGARCFPDTFELPGLSGGVITRKYGVITRKYGVITRSAGFITRS